MGLFTIFTIAKTTKVNPVVKAPYKAHKDCSKFDRFMNVVCYKMGLISRLE